MRTGPDAFAVKPRQKSAHPAADWLAHIGGGFAFLSAFASIYILCGAIAFGLDARQALLIDLGAFTGGIGTWTVAHVWRAAICRQASGILRHAACDFRLKEDVAISRVCVPDQTRTARASKRPGRPVTSSGVPVPA